MVKNNIKVDVKNFDVILNYTGLNKKVVGWEILGRVSFQSTNRCEYRRQEIDVSETLGRGGIKRRI